MTDHKNRFARARAVKANDQVSFSRIRTAEEDVAIGIARIAQAFGHRFGRDGGIAHGIGGVDFDELFKNIVRQLICSVIRLRFDR
jgi:tetrahydromethanopterin S-methyltransferase subunit G